MIQPKEIEIDGKIFIISKFPAVAGREIMAKYPTSGLPKIGDYKVNEEVMLKLMSYVAVPNGTSQPLKLGSQILINNHIVASEGAEAWETLGKIEIEMMRYNCSFFRDGRISTFFEDLAQKLPQWVSKTLTDLSARSSQKEKQPSTN